MTVSMGLTTEQEAQIAVLSAQGLSSREIGRRVGCNHKTVASKQDREDIRELIENTRISIFKDALNDAAENIKHVVKNYKTNKCTDKSEEIEKSHGFTASLKLNESAGVLASNIQSLTIQQIYNDNRTEVPESVRQLFDAIQKRDMCGVISNDVVEGEVE